MITLHDVTKLYGASEATYSALRQISFEIPSGDFVAIMGPSGSGKSTLLGIIGAINPPSSGKVVVDDVDLDGLSGDNLANFRRGHIGFVFQELYMLPYLTAIENVMVPLAVADVDGSRVQMALRALRDVGMETKALRLPDQLSGGERGRVAIARAIVNRPQILLADEPTGNLDSQTSGEVMRLLLSLNAKGHTIVMVTHNPDVANFAKRVIHLKDGAIVDEQINDSFAVVIPQGIDVDAEDTAFEDFEEDDENEWFMIGIIVVVAGLVLAFVLFGLQLDPESLHVH